MLNPVFDPGLLSRIEDAGLNASAPPQQRWMDGWLVRLSPGKAKRARCINAVAPGILPVVDKLEWCQAAYREAKLPLYFRITPFTRPAGLEVHLAAEGYAHIDDTRVMVLANLTDLGTPELPPSCRIEAKGHHGFAQQIGKLRASPMTQRVAHAQRLESSPVPYTGLAIVRDGELLACGQMAIENELVGLYDVYTAENVRGQGLARGLCKRLLSDAWHLGARHAYLQVEGDNHPARAIYRRLGFVDAYAYHYRTPATADQ